VRKSLNGIGEIINIKDASRNWKKSLLGSL
jgi:hypothetical protein